MISSIKKGNKKLICNDKGFSLVELIIVIAIMAVLIGVVGMQVVPYMNNSKKAKDLQILSAFATAGVTAYSSHPDSVSTEAPYVITITSGTYGDEYNCSEGAEVAAEMKKLVEKNYVTEANSIFASNDFKKTESIVVTFDFENHKISVYAKDGDGDDINDLDSVTGIL